ncbi:MAG: pilus assembly protein TadG-related protein [Acidobacteriota bacterium]
MKLATPKRLRERGVALLVGTASLLIIIPMVGLAVDVGYLYAVKARLQASVDGAALAAARSLNLGSSTAAQAASAQQNAVNWFYANFPSQNWGTTGTIMNTTRVQVYDDATNPNLRHVDITANTSVPTYFMKWLHFESTTITGIGRASRRDSVIMLVLDRSGSMCAPASSPCNNTGACGPMKTAAKLFTGQFAAGRDYIGLVSFSDGTYVHSAPTRNFRTVLGYTNSSASGSGAIDTIQCQGGTGSAQAISMGYNELYKTNLPGAMNVLLFESDGLPNTLAINMWDAPSNSFALANINGCTDATGKSKTAGGWTTFASRRLWQSSTIPMNSPTAGFMPDIPTGPIAGLYSTDPSGGQSFLLFMNPFHTSGNQSGASPYRTATACKSEAGHTDLSDFAWIPSTDVFGNSVNPPSHPYKAVTMNGTHLKFDSSQSTAQKWTNYHAGALNATDHAAYRARTNANLKASLFVIGLGGQGADPPDYTLMQRLANDSQADSFNTPSRYNACASTPSCYTYDDQPHGTFIFSTNQSTLKQAFLKLSSQILRLNQ